MADLTARTLTDADWPAFADLLGQAFLADLTEAEREREREPWEPQRSHGIYDGERLLGGGGLLTRALIVPGPAPHAVAAVSFVGVAPDARRRGVLTALMRAQLDGLHEAGAEPIAVLWASQAPIYGRFGYGVASRAAHATVPARAGFRAGSDVGPSGRIELVGAEAAAAPMRAVHTVAGARRVGWLSRPEPSWRHWLGDIESSRQGRTAFRYAIHHGTGGPDGYAVFRLQPGAGGTGPNHVLGIHELVTGTPSASVDIWRMLLDLDLVSEVRYPNLALDDPLPLLLADPRQLEATVIDQLWLRLVDLDRALAGRRYSAPCDVVLEVSDGFCPWNAGRWRLVTGADEPAEVARSDAAPDLRCDVADLAAAYLGGTRLTALAAAGRVTELRPGALVTASRALAGDAEPYCPEVF